MTPEQTLDAVTEEVASNVSNYLLLGMHHTTSHTQKEIAKIIRDGIALCSKKLTPNELSVLLDQKANKLKSNYDI